MSRDKVWVNPCYNPGGFITVDEQFFPSKARCPFTQLEPSKPDKYGPKYWLAANVHTKYVVNGCSHIGKDESRGTDKRVSDQIVIKLLQPYLAKERNVTTDNFFASTKLVRL